MNLDPQYTVDVKDPALHSAWLEAPSADNVSQIASVSDNASQESLSPEANDKTAILVFHGMGQQVPFETLNNVAIKLMEYDKKKSDEKKFGKSQSAPVVKYVQLGNDVFPRAELKLNGDTQEAHLYEAYWAPLTEGKVTAMETILFLFEGARKGLRFAIKGEFDRYLFGADRIFKIARVQTSYKLVLTGAVLMSQILTLFTFAGVFVVKILGGLGVNLPNTQLIDALNVDLILSPLTIGVIVCLLWPIYWLYSKFTQLKKKIQDNAGSDGVVRSIKAIIMQALVVIVAALSIATGVRILIHFTCLWHNGGMQFLSRFPGVSKFSAWESVSLLLDNWYGGAIQLIFWFVGFYIFYNLWWFMIQYLGDVAAYVSSYKVSQHQELREKIKDVGLDLASCIYGARDAGSTRFEYDRVLLVGHSLGSIVAYDTLNAMINKDLLSGQKGSVTGRTKLLLTFGSPLDKTAFIFRAQMKNAVIREALSAATQPLIQKEECRQFPWINIYSRNDWISGPLDYYDLPAEKGALPGSMISVENLEDDQSQTPLAAHTKYWEHQLLTQTLYNHI